VTSKSDLARYDALRRIGCLPCLKDRIRSEIDIHHLTDKGTRKLSGGNKASIPCCPWHHRGQPPDGWRPSDAYEFYGPSLRLQKREFTARYGTERELLAEVDALIKVPA
jgi:hypothetical protein